MPGHRKRTQKFVITTENPRAECDDDDKDFDKLILFNYRCPEIPFALGLELEQERLPVGARRKLTSLSKQNLIRWGERRRRMEEQERLAWEASGKTPEDPGLRGVYDQIPRAPIRLIACPFGKDVNHGGLLRLAEAFRLDGVDLARELDGAVDGAGHRGSKRNQPYRWIAPEVAIGEARAAGSRIYGLALRPEAVEVSRVNWQFPCALVLGSEKDGLPTEVSEMCDEFVAIPLYGLMTSLNVAVAAGIVVQYAIAACSKSEVNFEPVRNASRRLLGLERQTYEVRRTEEE